MSQPPAAELWTDREAAVRSASSRGLQPPMSIPATQAHVRMLNDHAIDRSQGYGHTYAASSTRAGTSMTMRIAIAELYRFRGLLWVWSLREIRIRYKQSLLGVLWAVLQPLSIMLIFAVIFGAIIKVPTDGIPYPLFFYSALLPWTFFAASIGFAVPTLISNLSLVTKIYFPREILPIASVIAAFVDFAIAAALFFVLMLAYGAPVTLSILWLPVLVILQLLLALGISLFGSALFVAYRDLRFVVPLALQLWMYVSPVAYSFSSVPERFRPLYMVNPMAGIVDAYRRVVLGMTPQWQYLVPEAVLIVAIFLLGFYYFKRKEASFADII